jgi:hypothetical protein
MVQEQRGASDQRTPIDLTPEPADLVRINGETHELARPSALTLRQRARVNWLANRLATIEAIVEPTEADELEHRKWVREAAGFALPSADGVLSRVDDEQLGDLVATFFTRSAARSPRLRELRRAIGDAATDRALEAMVPARSSGPSSSPGSSGSTAATREGGST